MNLSFPKMDMSGYKSNSQRTRVLSEMWLWQNGYCPYCKSKLDKFKNNKKLADFYCKNCKEEFELKSKDTINPNQRKIIDGEYYSKIERLKSENNPNLFFLTYKENSVGNLIFIPRYFFTENIIEKRKPLSIKARRAGWTGSNIILSLIPNNGKIFLVQNSSELLKEKSNDKLYATAFLKEHKLYKRSWIIDVLNCVNKIKKANFTLSDVYKFSGHLQALYPRNRNVNAKIRQQLQLLRNQNIIEFLGGGQYKRKL